MRIFPEYEKEVSSENGHEKGTFSISEYLPWIKIAAVVCVAIFVCVSIISISLTKVCFTAYIGGEEIGIVESPDQAQNALAQVKLDYLTQIDYSNVDLELTYSMACVPSSSIMSWEEITDKLTTHITEKYESAYELSINGQVIGACANRDDIDTVVELVSEELYDRISTVDSTANDLVAGSAIVVDHVLYKAEDISDSRAIYGILSAMAGVEGKLYGDYGNFDYNIIHTDSSEVRTSPYSSTCDFDCGLLKNADSTVTVYHHDHSAIESQKDFSSFYNTVKTSVFTEIIQFETEYVEDPNMMVGRAEKITDGTNGLREVSYTITFTSDGSEVSRQVIDENVISSPVNEVYRIGTMPVPDAVPTGTFIWPLESYIITSEYGLYRPEFSTTHNHYGVDLATKKGDPIYASDGGTVVKASLAKSYGLLVIIDHGNGVQTYYAHMSKILVNEGDKVYQGQQIGRVGRTGTATGDHLHFEVRFDGETADPLDYLPKQTTNKFKNK